MKSCLDDSPMCFGFYSLLTPAFLALLFLATADYPQRHLGMYERPLISYVKPLPVPERVARRTSEGGDQFGDEVRSRGSGNSLLSARDLRVEEGPREDRRRDNRS